MVMHAFQIVAPGTTIPTIATRAGALWHKIAMERKFANKQRLCAKNGTTRPTQKEKTGLKRIVCLLIGALISLVSINIEDPHGYTITTNKLVTSGLMSCGVL